MGPLSLDDFKQFALDQAGQPPTPMPNLQPSQGSQIANTIDTTSPQTPQAQDVQPKQGPIKSFLSQFIYGAGQGLLNHVGLQTDAQKQQVQSNQQQQTMAGQRAQQGANDLSAYRQAQTGGLQAKADLLDQQNQPFQIPNDPGIPQALRGQTTTVGNWQALSKIFTQNQGKTDVADTRADATRDVATTRAGAATQNAETAANVRRDIASGNLRMAGARLSLAQQVAAAKANGSYGNPPADRLRRGDLANNAQDNINTTIEDVKSNPDLFGQIAGHFTTVQEMLGSNNPAIRKIAVQIHNAALASNGAHGLRSAQAVPDTEKTIINSFRDSPETTIAGLNAMNQSLDTFIQDAQHGKQFVPRGTNTPVAPGAATHRFNPATGKIEAIQ